jgi:ATPase subunit of ABC transporter with duplicated ATPase domains
MLMFDDLSAGYRGEDGDKIIVRGVDRSVLAGQRIGILGANGQGKSTLVKTIARAQAPMGGKLTEGKGLSIGYFAQQELDVLRLDEGPLEQMVRLARRAASRSCATSSASSASPATWSTRPSAACPAARRRAWCWRCWCGSAPTCCCWTSPPTTWT